MSKARNMGKVERTKSPMDVRHPTMCGECRKFIGTITPVDQDPADKSKLCPVCYEKQLRYEMDQEGGWFI